MKIAKRTKQQIQEDLKQDAELRKMRMTLSQIKLEWMGYLCTATYSAKSSTNGYMVFAGIRITSLIDVSEEDVIIPITPKQITTTFESAARTAFIDWIIAKLKAERLAKNTLQAAQNDTPKPLYMEDDL